MNYRDDDTRYAPPMRRSNPKRHDPDEEMRKAIWRADAIEQRGHDVTLRYRDGTFISFMPLPNLYRDDVKRRLNQMNRQF
jgi:hypothetical protein